MEAAHAGRTDEQIIETFVELREESRKAHRAWIDAQNDYSVSAATVAVLRAEANERERRLRDFTFDSQAQPVIKLALRTRRIPLFG